MGGRLTGGLHNGGINPVLSGTWRLCVPSKPEEACVFARAFLIGCGVPVSCGVFGFEHSEGMYRSVETMRHTTRGIPKECNHIAKYRSHT